MTLRASFIARRLPWRLFHPAAALLGATLALSAGCDGGNALNGLARPDGAPAQGVLAPWGTD